MPTISALQCGERPTARSILFYRDTGTEPVIARFQYWLLQIGSRRVLIDAGIPAADPRLSALAEPRPTAEHWIDFDRDRVTDVVLTHLHWDHVGDVDLFPHAVIHVQARELDFLKSTWFTRPALRPLFAADDKLEWITGNPQLHRIDGDCEIARGLIASWVGGHTPGSQIIVLQADEHRAVFTGDAINTIYNLNNDLPPGIVWSMPEALDALSRIRALAQAGYVIVPAHEAIGPQPETRR